MSFHTLTGALLEEVSRYVEKEEFEQECSLIDWLRFANEPFAVFANLETMLQRILFAELQINLVSIF